MLKKKAIHTFIFYLKRPQYYCEFLRRIISLDIDNPLRDKQRKKEFLKGSSWCESHTSTREELGKLIGFRLPLLSFQDENHEAFSSAMDAIHNSPIKHIQPASLNFIYTICLTLKPTIVVETGVANGWSAAAILTAMEVNNHGRLLSIDMPYPRYGNDEEVGLVVAPSLRSRWNLIRKSDREGLPQVLRSHKEIDIAHYDSDKSYKGRMFAYDLLWNKLRKGGILVSDDIGDNFAFRDFALKVDTYPWVFKRESGCNYMGVLVK